MCTHRRVLLWILLVALAVSGPVLQVRLLAQTAGEERSAKTWLGRAQELEEYLKSAEIISMQDVGRGVTNPKRCKLAPGGPVEEIAWKAIKPARYRGFWESYKAEIAAYELDKLLGLDMVPVKVERRVKGDLGAAIMWVTPTQSFADLGRVPTAPPAHFERWNRQMMRAKMFDNLIANTDPNMGNWLVDPAWNLILVDHSRAFTTEKKMTHQMQRIDAELWERMRALTEEQLAAALSKWLDKGEIRAILERRDRMQAEIDKMVKARGEAAVFVR